MGNAIPYFILPYNIKHQSTIYRHIDDVVKRLGLNGISVAKIGLFDLVIDFFQSSNELESLFESEPTVTKSKLLVEMGKMLSVEKIIVPEILRITKEKDASIIFIYQVGEVYPYLRVHEILNNLQIPLSDRPVIVFFPGTYTNSIKEGFKLSLFGIQTANYYQAFKLDDFLPKRSI